MRAVLGNCRRGAYKRDQADPPDTELFWVRLKEDLSKHMLRDDSILVSPALKDVVGDGEFCLIEVAEEYFAGEMRMAAGKGAVRMPSGRRFEHGTYQITGKVVGFRALPR